MMKVREPSKDAKTTESNDRWSVWYDLLKFDDVESNVETSMRELLARIEDYKQKPAGVYKPTNYPKCWWASTDRLEWEIQQR